MNTLDKHRILEKGDEYFTNAKEWKPVPSADWGIQIMFTKYTQVRRPGEAPSKSHSSQPLPAGNHTISPSGEKPESAPVLAGTVRAKHDAPSAGVTAQVESDQVARPVVARGAGERFSPTDQLIADAVAAEAALKQGDQDGRKPEAVHKKHDPKIPSLGVSRGATEPDGVDKGAATAPPLTETEKAMVGTPTFVGEIEKAVTKAKAAAHTTDNLEIGWTNKDLVWTGRNGTFGCFGLEAANHSGEHVNLVPRGKRGVGNCLIQFPVSAIPLIVDWLNKQRTTT